MILFRLVIFLCFGLVIFVSNSYAYDITDKFSIGGVLSGAYQYQWVDGDDNKGRGAVPFQPEFSLRPTGRDEIFAGFGFAAGNGLNGVSNFNLAPWAADLEDDVKDINGRNRDYLLTVWYKHTFEFGENNALGLTSGIIDSTAYVDENAFANDEYTLVAEAYWRFVLNDYFAVTADIQYMKDKYDVPGIDDLEGLIGGIRMTAEFKQAIILIRQG